LEKKTGSPEKPLSALGQMTYKSYWRSAILIKLDEYRRSQIHATITQLRFVRFFISSQNSFLHLALTPAFVSKMLFSL
jgi:hypothetical protein